MESTEPIKKTHLGREEAELRKTLLTDSNGNYSIDYNLLLVLRKAADKSVNYPKYDFEGKLVLKFNLFKKESSEGLFLNYYGDIKSVNVNGTDTQTNFKNQRLYFDNSLLKEENTITILFLGIYNTSGVGLHHYVDPSDQKEYLYTQFEPYDCNRLFPCFDQPDLKATLTLSVVAPKEWIVLGNEYENENKDLTSTELDDVLNQKEKALLLEENNILSKNYHYYKFNKTPRISSYLYALCAGPYYKMECPYQTDVPLRLFFRESLKGYGEPEEFFKITIAGMKWYKDYFGIAYPFNKYDQIFCPEYNMGAMENVGLVTYNEYYCWKDKPTQRKRTGFAITVLHELAHMWFGNLVTMKWWDDLWLNESFATFISHLCMDKSEELKHYTTSWLLFGNYKGYAYRADQQTTTHPVMSDVKNTEIAETHFDEIVYEKGSAILKQMYYFIGDHKFSNGLKHYFDTYKWNNTVFDDFIGKMITTEDTNNLKELSHSWLKKAGLNEITLDMEIKDGKVSKFNVIQKACLSEHNNLQTHMMDILLIHDIENTEEFKNIIIKPTEVTSLEQFIGKNEPKAVILNYNDWAYCKWVIDTRSIEYLKSNLHKINDLLTKQLVYRSLFDLTRDSRISSIEYLNIVLNLLNYEKDEDIITTLLRNVSGIISNYIPLKYYEQYTTKLFDLVKELIYKTVSEDENNDLLLHLVDHLISFAHGDAHIEFLKKWLTDGPVVNDKRLHDKYLTQENRFNIAALVHRSRNVSKEEKEKILLCEMERDKNSERAILAKYACYASQPDKAIKEELWNKFVKQSTSESLYNMQSLLDNFASKDQLDLVQEYLTGKFFDDLYNVGKDNDFFYVKSFIENLTPKFYVNEDIIDKLHKLSDKVKSLDAVNLCLREQIDDMKRMLKAQQKCEEYLNR
jgi:aminopeptidase N